MVAELAALAVLVFATLAELLHWRRVRRVARLAFGPGGLPEHWARAAPWLRAAAMAGLAWSAITLMEIVPRVHDADGIDDADFRHLVMVLDVSPSMRLQDAGPSGIQSRMSRASDVMDSFFERVAMEQYKVSVIAVYNGAKPVVVDTTDLDVVRNILEDLPMHYAFKSGKTDIFAGLQEAAETVRPWQPKSTTVVLVSDGDTVPAHGMPAMPASVSGVLVVGVGDEITGKFIDGRQSRQEASTLRQIAVRLDGVYQNGNTKHLSTSVLQAITLGEPRSALEELTRREYALLVLAVSGLTLALLPVLLHLLGTRWQPGPAIQGGSGHLPGRSPSSSASKTRPHQPALPR